KDVAQNKISATKIVISDRDRILARLFISMYGSNVESTVPCTNCNEDFDISFSLEDLLNHYHPSHVIEKGNGTYELENGTTFRLPNGEDEMSIRGMSASMAESLLLERCLIKGNPEADKERVQSKMEELAPVLNVDIEAKCPECNHVQQVKFDMQSFFMMKLKQERATLFSEVHCLAATYHWSQKEILELPRQVRKKYVELITGKHE
nr:hypothetical protein [Bacteroidia bacterium]